MLLQYLFGKLVQHKIGGITGDTLGALVELSEVMYGFLLYICIHAMGMVCYLLLRVWEAWEKLF